MRARSGAAHSEAVGHPGMAARPPHPLPELIKAAGLLDELHEAERAASRALIELSQLRSQAQAISMDVSECCDRYGHPQEEDGQAPCG